MPRLPEKGEGIGSQVKSPDDVPSNGSLERGGHGSSMRAYVVRTLPDYSPILVSNRAPHEPKPEGGFKRGAGGVITALLTMAEATGADWVACARTDDEREFALSNDMAVTVPLLRSTGRLHYAM